MGEGQIRLDGLAPLGEEAVAALDAEGGSDMV